MQRTAANGPRPSPQAAYSQRTDACTNAGWPGVPVAEQVPIREALGRVTAAPVRARWPAPSAACAAMDGIAIKAGPVGRPADAAGRWWLAASPFAWADTGDPVRPGDVTDSDSPMLASRAEDIGAGPLISDVQPDDPAAIAAEIRRAALAADIVLVIAGSSAGRRDHTAAVLALVGALAIRGSRSGRATLCCSLCPPGAARRTCHDCPRDRDPRLPARCRGDLRAVRCPPARHDPEHATLGSCVATSTASVRLDFLARCRALGPRILDLGPGRPTCQPHRRGHAG